MPNERILFNENFFSYYYMTGFGSVFKCFGSDLVRMSLSIRFQKNTGCFSVYPFDALCCHMGSIMCQTGVIVSFDIRAL